MAVHVLLSFPNDAEAKRFVADMLQHPNQPLLSPVQENEAKATVCGVWKEPTLYCECGKSHKAGYTRGRKYGWWVCANCGKPSKVGGKRASTKWELALGTNLLPPEVSPEFYKERINNWRSEAEWRELVPEGNEEPSNA